MTPEQKKRLNDTSDRDFKAADALKGHCLTVLQSTLVKYKDMDGKDQQRSMLTPTELSSIARALESVQRIQRLALGLPVPALGKGQREGLQADGVPLLED